MLGLSQEIQNLLPQSFRKRGLPAQGARQLLDRRQRVQVIVEPVDFARRRALDLSDLLRKPGSCGPFDRLLRPQVAVRGQNGLINAAAPPPSVTMGAVRPDGGGEVYGAIPQLGPNACSKTSAIIGTAAN